MSNYKEGASRKYKARLGARGGDVQSSVAELCRKRVARCLAPLGPHRMAFRKKGEGNAALVAQALDRFGRLDSACYVTGVIVVGKFLEMTLKQWEQIKRSNLDMVFHALQAAIPPMVGAGAGQIVVFTSSTGGRPEPMTSIYGGTRAGANGIVRAVGLEHARDGVQVNAVGTNFMDFPGFIAASFTPNCANAPIPP